MTRAVGLLRGIGNAPMKAADRLAPGEGALAFFRRHAHVLIIIAFIILLSVEVWIGGFHPRG